MCSIVEEALYRNRPHPEKVYISSKTFSILPVGRILQKVVVPSVACHSVVYLNKSLILHRWSFSLRLSLHYWSCYATWYRVHGNLQDPCCVV